MRLRWLLGSLLVALSLAPPAAAIEFGDPVQVAIETDRVIDQISVAPMDLSLRPWTDEILPWFLEEGIVKVVRPPARVDYVKFGARWANHVLGSADCARGFVSINHRYANPVSSWYRSVDLVLTLTHELAHVQQKNVCERAPDDNVEASAQLMSFEVDAALALSGNTWAAVALLRELRRIAVGMVRYDALRELPGAQTRLDALRARIYSTAEGAEVAQRDRYWAAYGHDELANLWRYVVLPYRKLAAALGGDLVVTGLATPINPFRQWERTPTNGTLLVDDLGYFLDHMSALYGTDER